MVEEKTFFLILVHKNYYINTKQKRKSSCYRKVRVDIIQKAADNKVIK
jgi:hypothetical protein